MSTGSESPVGALTPGTRVKVVHDAEWEGPWRDEFYGTVDYSVDPPRPVTNSSARPGELEYWVQFDESQFDYDGDGPYRKALIWDRYLVVVN
ncbi:hypothetical protein [Nocardia sp. NBC_00416]|uniref:hypothetical protein n=1 Tax=Nocardia sp. NBC_00416 TaxID=2975991 RepID=UPI002E1C4A4B